MRKRLMRVDLFKVVNYLNANWEILKKEQFTREVLEEKLKQETGLEIEFGYIKKICKDLNKDIAEITSVRSRSVSGHKTDRVRLLASQVAALTVELQRCYSLLGEKFNPDGSINVVAIRKIVGGKSLTPFQDAK